MRKKQGQRQGNFMCGLCGRDTFDKKSPHRCQGGYRKRRIPWINLK